ncbi:hypothetical protein NQU59_11940 [Acinetobacter colistiniresistens]|uniref:hypothetical protein n=1 Tax=Acinetobacter colistiniresistens TaxID=280145 RepID=UPI00211CD175|nr:hypothetical protein [Acinetobacter colistiniresistens]UUM26405.1 hypothetical protein NQU59_11940 [Acinetobacter colistiniresistens]
MLYIFYRWKISLLINDRKLYWAEGFFESEIDITSNDSSELFEFKAALDNDIRQMHPVLYNILKEDWDLYIDIVEGVPETWQIFLEKLKEFDKEK